MDDRNIGSKFLLLVGPSGVGKTTLINELLRLDSKFVYISPYMTRPIRDGEKNKIPISYEKFEEMEKNGDFLIVNSLFGGVKYGTPKASVFEIIAAKNYPILDWPLNKLGELKLIFSNGLFVVYVSPPSIEVLRQRLEKDGRDKDGTRLSSAVEELNKYWSFGYTGLFDYEVVSEEGQISRIAKDIYKKYLLGT